MGSRWGLVETRGRGYRSVIRGMLLLRTMVQAEGGWMYMSSAKESDVGGEALDVLMYHTVLDIKSGGPLYKKCHRQQNAGHNPEVNIYKLVAQLNFPPPKLFCSPEQSRPASSQQPGRRIGRPWLGWQCGVGGCSLVLARSLARCSPLSPRPVQRPSPSKVLPNHQKPRRKWSE